jgi:hypothetical protein
MRKRRCIVLRISRSQAIEHKKRKNIEAVEEHLAKKGFTAGSADASFDYPSDYQLPSTALDTAAGGGRGEAGGEGDYWSQYYARQAMVMDSALSYPDTDAQFEAALDKADSKARQEAAEATGPDLSGEGSAAAAAAVPEAYSAADIFGSAADGSAAAQQQEQQEQQEQERQQQWAAYYRQQQWAAYYQQQAASQQTHAAPATAGSASAPAAAAWPEASADSSSTVGVAAQAAPQRNIGPRPPPRSQR